MRSAIHCRRAFRVGDRIRVGEVLGDVSEIRLQVTHVRSIKNEEIVVPNSTLLQSHVTNYSTLARSRGLILHMTPAYESDPDTPKLVPKEHWWAAPASPTLPLPPAGAGGEER